MNSKNSSAKTDSAPKQKLSMAPIPFRRINLPAYKTFYNRFGP